MCRGRHGCSHFVLDRMKRQAPVWRASYKPRAGAKRARWWVDGKRGNRRDYRLNRKRSSKGACVIGSRLAAASPTRLDSLPLGLLDHQSNFAYAAARIAWIRDSASPPFSFMSEA
mgnify:CR=1 FL=1